MKRSERQHLKTNELATTVARFRDTLEARKRTFALALAATIVLVLAVAGYAVWRQRTSAQAAERLAEAMAVMTAPVVPPSPATPDGQAGQAGSAPATPATPAAPPPGSFASERAKLEAALPKFLAAAEVQPSSVPSIAARYHAASVLALLGRDADAEQRYREVIDRAGSSIYGRTARLGLAEVQARRGNYDAAIKTWQDLASTAKEELPVDGVLIQLGRTYAQAGKNAEAAQTFNRVVDEFPDSVYASTAREELEILKSRASK